MSPEELQRKADIVNKCISIMSEHFDAVQVHACFLTPENQTQRLSLGSGNWYARKGMAQEFLEMDQAQTVASEIEKARPKDE